MRVCGGDYRGNLDHAVELLGEASRRGAQVALLPEALNFGWTDSAARRQAEPIPDGFAFAMLAAAAHSLNLYICAGLIEKQGSRIFNSAVLIDSSGRLVLRHRKLNELAIAHDLYEQGDKLETAVTPFGCIGVMICSDAFAPGQVISRALGYMGASVILSPCAWAVQHDHDNLREPYGDLWRTNYSPVARDFQLWIAAASNVGRIDDGPWKGRKCIGCSMIIDPRGVEVMSAPYGEDAEAVLLAEISPVPRPARGDSWAARWKAKVPDR